MYTVFLREHLLGVRSTVQDPQNIHSAVADVAEHITAIELLQVGGDRGEALGKHFCAYDANVIVFASVVKVYLPVLEQILLKGLFLFSYPG